jgi:DNA-binding SARP family transcriptional activator
MGHFREARQLVDRALSIDGDVAPLFRGRALITSALTALAQGEYARSCAAFEAALPLLRDAGDEAGTAVALAKLGAAQLLGGNIGVAVPTLDEALAFTSEMPTHDIGKIFARFWRGWASYALGEFDVAHELVASNIRVAREHALPTTLAHALVTLARIELGKDNVERACQYVMEGLELEAAINDAWGIGLALDVVAIAAARRGRPGVSTQILAGVAAHRERLAVALPGLVPAEREALLLQLREQLGERFDARYAEGQVMTTTELVGVALGEAARHTTEHRVVSIEESFVPAAPVEQPRLRVLALGPLQVYAGDRLIESSAWGSARSRELLVYLLMHPEGRTKEQAGLAFWPEASSVQLRNSFHVTLHRLRKALGRGDWVALDGDRYRIDPEVVDSFDVMVFEKQLADARRALQRQQEDGLSRLEQALAHFRGDFLDGEPGGDWHLDHRERLQRLYLTGLMELGERQVRGERYEKAADSYRRVLARDEFHEEAMLALLKCNAAMGERSQALRAYRRYVDRLRQELEAEPGRDISRFAERLQDGAHV